ncbi:MAG: low molecular weight phosphotyrosine protein phosphatase [Sulfuritalea sp.]|jgi:protein-tyrosine phosphatase|nr:low molecular weight phosphotyrosine protein phosphatase [Sulfuritalea sp.]
MTPNKVLFVCTGNICRSPSAEGVARALAARQGVERLFEFDSAGTHGYHVGKPPDPRAIAAALRRGYDLSPLRARRVTEFDFIRFDYVLAMDREHLELLQRACPPQYQQKLKMFLDFGEDLDQEEVPDPYYGDAQGFELVLDLVEDAATQLILKLSANRVDTVSGIPPGI